MAEENKESISPLMHELANYLPEIDLLQTQTSSQALPPDPAAPATTEEEATEAEEVEDIDAEEAEEQEAEEATQDAKDTATKEWPESARKRVDKLTAKLREAEESGEATKSELEQMRQELADLKTGKTKVQSPAQSGAASNPMEDVWSETDLMAKADGALNWKRWAVENPDGGTMNLDGKDREFGPEEVRAILLNADRLLSVEIPRRREFLAKTGAIEQGLRSEFPEMFDEKSAGWKGMMDALATLPELKARPDGMGLAMMLSLGLGEMQRLRAEKGKPDTTSKTAAAAGAVQSKAKPKAQIAPTPVKPSGGPSAPAGKPDTKNAALAEVFASGGDAEALEKYFTGG
jgi:hypothetical protein